MRGFHVDSDSHAETSSGEESYFPETPEDERFPPTIFEDERGFKLDLRDGDGEEDACFGEGVVFSPSVLPVHREGGSIGGMVSLRAPVSFAESCLYWISPYEELREAAEGEDCEKAEKVLGRLLTEWYVVGASVSFSHRARKCARKTHDGMRSYWR